MVDLEQYDIALAKHHDTRDTITTPFVLGFPPQVKKYLC
jgi:hypothetical protein